MAWELLAIWAIVTVTLTWFVRDEKRRVADADVARSARYYAHAPKYRHISTRLIAAPAMAPARRAGGLTQEQRSFLKALQQQR